MTDKTASQTIAGSYRMVEMPDGTTVAMQKLDNGKWVTTEERLSRSTTEFMRKFEGTDTVPCPHIPQTEGTLIPKSGTEKMLHSLEEAKQSRNRLDAYLGEILGAPEDIMAKHPICMENLKRVRSRPQELRHVLGLMDIIGAWDIRWQRVRKMLMNISE